MDIIKISENIVKDYSTDTVNGKEIVNNVQYQLKDGTEVKGSANCTPNNINISINGLTGKSIEDLETLITQMIAVIK